MSEQSDYDRLRADVLAFRYALVSQHGYSVSDVRRLLDSLMEKHPARDEVETVLNMTDTELAEHYRQNGEDIHEVAQKTRKLILDAVERHESEEPPPPTPARATAISELVTALTLSNAPLGTRAPAIGGGHWERVKHGWKWCTGDTFPRPGGDWNGKLMPPPQAKAPQLSREEVEIAIRETGTRGQLITRLRAESSPKDSQ